MSNGVGRLRVSGPQTMAAPLRIMTPSPMVNITVENCRWPMMRRTMTASNSAPNAAIATTASANPTQ